MIFGDIKVIKLWPEGISTNIGFDSSSLKLGKNTSFYSLIFMVTFPGF